MSSAMAGARTRHPVWQAYAVLGLAVGLARPVPCAAQGAARASSAAPAATLAALVFEGVTIVDVEQGKLVPDQRVVIVGNRIKSVGHTVPLPKDARVVDARGKFLLPGLWDVHTHPSNHADILYPLFLANGVTGIRNASSPVPLDTMIQLRREIVAGMRIGPPRQILSGAALDGPVTDECTREAMPHICLVDSADARHVVDSLKAAGVDMLKMYGLSRDMYFFIAAEARRRGILFGGHAGDVTAADASDSGASIIDHLNSSGGLEEACWGRRTVEQCQPLADRLAHHNTWFDPTLIMFNGAMINNPTPRSEPLYLRLVKATQNYWAGSLPRGNWFHDTATAPETSPIPTYSTYKDDDTVGGMRLIERVGLPLLAGTDVTPRLSMSKMAAGFALHTELAMYVAEGLSPLRALQSATLNPAKMLRATDSLGTVAAGKLADLVLLDANPLEDITNTTTIRAVVANGRYFDRAALDQVLTDVQDRVKRDPPIIGP